MKENIFIPFIVLFAIPIARASTICDTDLNVTMDNKTAGFISNGVYNISVNNATYNLTVNNCLVNQTILINQTVLVNQTIIINQTQACQVDRTLRINESYVNTTFPCQVNVTTVGEFWCPQTLGCPVVQTCNITDTIYPKEGNVSFYENFTYPCGISLTVSDCPTGRFNVPTNYSVIEKERLSFLESQANSSFDGYLKCSTDLSKENFLKTEAEAKARQLRDGVCLIDDKKMLECYKELPMFSRGNLDQFAKLTEFIDNVAFAQLIGPKATGYERTNIEYFAEDSLNRYYKCGFADSECYTYYNEMYAQNFTKCYYKPQISEFCVKKIPSLMGIEESGSTSGRNTVLIWGSIVVLSVFAIIYIMSRWSYLPPI